MGRDGYHIFFKDLEAETIHVCIAWALLQYLGSVLFSFAGFVAPGFQFSSILFFDPFWLVHRFSFGEMGDTRILITSLPRGAVAGWGVWLRRETMGCGVVFCF